MAEQDVYANPPPVPGELEGGGDGSRDHPFHSVANAMTKAHENGGGVVHLHGGHYVESVELEAVSGLDGPIVVQPVGEGEVFIDSLLPEFLVPGPDDGWDPVTQPGGSFIGEYVLAEAGTPRAGRPELDQPVG